MVGDGEVLAQGRGDERGPRFGGRTVAVAALVLAVVAAGAALLAVHGESHRPPAPIAAPTPPHSSQALPPPTTAGSVRALSITGTVWSAHDHLIVAHTSPNTVAMVVPGSLRPAWTRSVPGQPVGVAAGAGRKVWVITRDDSGKHPFFLLAFDVGTGAVVDNIELPAVPFSVAVTRGHVWVGSDNALIAYALVGGGMSEQTLNGDAATALAVDPTTQKVYGLLTGQARTHVRVWAGTDGNAIPLASYDEPGTIGTGGKAPVSLAVGFGALWVTTLDQSGNKGAVQRLRLSDLAPLEPGRAADLGTQTVVTAGPTAMWLFVPDSESVDCFRPTNPDYTLTTNFPDATAAGGPEGGPINGPSLAIVGGHVYESTSTIADLDAATICPQTRPSPAPTSEPPLIPSTAVENGYRGRQVFCTRPPLAGRITYDGISGQATLTLGVSGLPHLDTIGVDWINGPVRGYTIASFQTDQRGRANQRTLRMFRPGEVKGYRLDLEVGIPNSRVFAHLSPC